MYVVAPLRVRFTATYSIYVRMYCTYVCTYLLCFPSLQERSFQEIAKEVSTSLVQYVHACTYVRIYVYMYVHVYVRTYVRMCVHVYVQYVYTCVCMRAHVYVRTYVCTCVCAYVCKCVCTYVCVYMCIIILYTLINGRQHILHTRVHTRHGVFVWKYAYKSGCVESILWLFSWYVRMYVTRECVY